MNINVSKQLDSSSSFYEICMTLDYIYILH